MRKWLKQLCRSVIRNLVEQGFLSCRIQPLQISAHRPSSSSFLGQVICRSGPLMDTPVVPVQREAQSGARMEGLAAGRAATEAVSRPQGLGESRTLIRQRGLDSAKPLAPMRTAAGQTQHSPGHAALPLRSEEKLPFSFPQDAAPSADALHKLAGRKEHIQAWKGTYCSCTDKEGSVGALSTSTPSVSAHLHIRIQPLTGNWPLLPAPWLRGSAVLGRCWQPCRRLPFTHVVSFPPLGHLLHLPISSHRCWGHLKEGKSCRAHPCWSNHPRAKVSSFP